MRLRIIQANFTKKYDWLFKLNDENGNVFFIMNNSFYEINKFKSPITKKELDYFDKGQWITASTVLIDELNVVITIQ